MFVVLLGAPGSGKGTQAEKLSKHFHVPHISTGDILRGSSDPEIQKIVNAGKLVPDDVMMKIVRERLSSEKKGWILDGFPRTLSQVATLNSFPFKVIYFKISDDLIKKRLSLRRTCEKCGAIYHLENKPPQKPSICDLCGGSLIQRNDDKPEIIAERLKAYHEKTAPLINHFKEQGNLIEISSENSPEETFNLILAKKIF